MEWKIGEIRKVNGEWYQCVEGTCNNECYFYNRSLHKTIAGINGNGFGACNACFRNDNKSVIFKKLEKVGEPFIGKVHFQFQRYKIYAEPIVDPAENIGYINEENTIAIEIKESKEDNNGMTSDIDWEQVRIRTAILALQGFASNPNSTSATVNELANWSVSCADNLIAELKKGGEK